MIDEQVAWLAALAGRFLVFDGPDGSGKTTQFTRLCALGRQAGLTVSEVREPGGTRVGERIRDILLDPIHEEMSLRCEMMLYMASRAQLVEERIRPALDRGELVVADRFISSTFAYQGTAGGLPREEIEHVALAACGPKDGTGVWPHLTLIFDVDEKTAAHRLNPLLDRMEAKGAVFHAKVRRGFHEQAQREPDRFALIDATQDTDAVTRDMLDVLKSRFGRTP